MFATVSEEMEQVMKGAARALVALSCQTKRIPKDDAGKHRNAGYCRILTTVNCASN